MKNNGRLSIENDLTKKEITALKMASEGHTSIEIGEAIALSARTVEGMFARLKFKFDCKSLTHLCCEMIRAKVIT